MNTLTLAIPAHLPRQIFPSAHLRAAYRLFAVTIAQWLHPQPRRTADDIAFEAMLAAHRIGSI
jgi:hypothetical protein